MKIIIVSGGHIGSNVARHLVSENQQVTVLEKSSSVVDRLENQLDAMVICGDATNINVLEEAGIKDADIFIPVTDQDNVNILSSILAKKLNPALKIIAKVKYYSYIFDGSLITPEGLYIDHVINPNDIIINKIACMMDYPEATEIESFYEGRVQLVGFTADRSFPFLNKTLIETVRSDQFFHGIRVVAIQNEDKLVIPNGNSRIEENDRVFLIAKTPDIKTLMKKYIQKKAPLKHLILASEPQILLNLVEQIQRSRRRATIIEQDRTLCQKYTHKLDSVTVIHGAATDASVFRELSTAHTGFAAITDADEFNIVSCATAKSRGISKVMCSIRDIPLVRLINSVAAIDAVFSSNVIAAGEILQHTRGGHINSMVYFSGVPAEIIEISIADPIPSLNKPISEAGIPAGMIISSILRKGRVIIPTGSEELHLNDQVTCFILPEALDRVDRFFGSNLVIGR